MQVCVKSPFGFIIKVGFEILPSLKRKIKKSLQQIMLSNVSLSESLESLMARHPIAVPCPERRLPCLLLPVRRWVTWHVSESFWATCSHATILSLTPSDSLGVHDRPRKTRTKLANSSFCQTETPGALERSIRFEPKASEPGLQVREAFLLLTT